MKNVNPYSRTRHCLPSCSGLIVTSYAKEVSDKNLEMMFPKEISAYNDYKKRFLMPTELKG